MRWRIFKECPRYLVSSCGKIWDSKGRRFLKQTNLRGYLRCSINYGDYKKTWRVHRLVAITYLECNDTSLQVNHIDGDKENNNESNLEWVTSKENIHHAWNTGLASGKKGISHGQSILTDEIVKDIISFKGKGIPQWKVAEMFGTVQTNISLIWRNKAWTHIPR